MHGLPGIVYANVAGIFESVLRVMGKVVGEMGVVWGGGFESGGMVSDLCNAQEQIDHNDNRQTTS